MPTSIVRHPVPVWHVPRGGRVPRLGFLAAATPVTLREAAPSAFEPRATLPIRPGGAQVALLAHAGGLWRRLGDPGGPGIGVEALGLYLADAAGVRHDPDLHRHFLMTPVAAGAPPSPNGQRRAARGSDAPQGRILSDGSGWVPARLRGFLTGELAIVEGIAHVRVRPVASLDPSTPTRLVQHVAPAHWRLQGHAAPPHGNASNEANGYAVRADRPGDLALLDPAFVPSAPPADGRIPADLLGDGDLRLMGNVLPGLALAEAAAAIAAARRLELPDGGAAIAERARDLVPAALYASLGALEGEAMAGALERCASLSRAIQSTLGPLYSASRLPILERYVAQVALPRLRRTGAEDDLDAVGILAP